MFRFLEAATADEQMAELERFVEWWYGPRKPEYGEPESRLYSLPMPLKRFFAFAGRWPAPRRPDWISGCWGGSAKRRIQQVSDSLSAFLIMHVLMTTVYDTENASLSGSPVRGFTGAARTTRIWSTEDCTCPNYTGEFFLLDEWILLHQTNRVQRMAAIHHAGVERLRQILPED